MTTHRYGIRDGERLSLLTREPSPGARIQEPGGANPGVASVHGGSPDTAYRAWRLDPPFGLADGWTDAHSEVARFVGESFAFGAVCGFVVELARSTRRRRDA
jgi:hypothetical protein